MDTETSKYKYKWNLNDIYTSWDEWEKDLEKAKELMKEVPKYKDKLKYSPKNLETVQELEEKLNRLIDKIYLYPYLMKDLDSTDKEASSRIQEIQAILTDYSVLTAWINPEILQIPKDNIVEWSKTHKFLNEYKFSFLELFRLQKHVLKEENEMLLSQFSQYFTAPRSIYSDLSISDIRWNKVELSDGFSGEINNANYGKIVSTNRNQEDRKKTFEALYSSYEVNKNTYASIYRSILQKNVASAKVRKYNNTLEQALEPNNIPTAVFDNLLSSAINNSSVLKRYVELRKKALKLEEYHFYDNNINIVDFDKIFEYDTAKDIIINSVESLGEDYVNKLKKALSEGWLDVFDDKNKRSGAYSLNIYDVHPYMLLNYQKTIDSVFTLAHELGHTLHSMLATETQAYATASYTIFVAEVASTFNERLLLDYLIKNSDSKLERISLIEKALNNIVSTFFTQTIFANYERTAHKLVEEGKAITVDVLDSIMVNLFDAYFGDTVKKDELHRIIWSRIPHFFNSPYYVYQYATSFAASANIYDRVTNTNYTKASRKEAMDSYISLLKSGGNNHPIDQLKLAGVNLEEESAFDSVFKDFDRLLNLLEKELSSLES